MPITIPALPHTFAALSGIQDKSKLDDNYATIRTALTGVALQAADLLTLPRTQDGVYNVRGYGATGDGTTDDTAAIQSAITAAAAAGGGLVWLPEGVYVISRLDLTEITNGVILQGTGVNSTRFMPKAGTASYGTATGHLFDCTGSAQLVFRDFQVGAFNQTPEPTTAFFLAQVASGVSNAIHFDSVHITGLYTAATLYVYGVPSCSAVNTDVYNYSAGAGTFSPLTLTASNVDSLTSDFATVETGDQVTADWTFTACEFHKFAGASADTHVLHLDGAKDCRFVGGVVSGGAVNYVGTAGQVDRVLFLGTTFETESEPVTPTNLLAVGATGASDVKFLNCLAISTSFLGGAGAFTAGASNNQHFDFNITAGTTIAGNLTRYLGPAGSDETEGNARLPLPYGGVLNALECAAGGSPGSGQTFTYTVMVNGVASAITAAMADASTTAADATHFVNVNKGDVISVRVVTSATANTVGGHRATIGVLARPQTAF